MDTSDRTLIGQSKLFQGVDFSSVEYMLESCVIRNLTIGECLVEPDAPNDFLYLLLDGKLGVHLAVQESKTLGSGATDSSTTFGGSVSQSLVLATVLPGECVGEMSLIDGKHPSALVVATEPSRVLAIPHDTVWSLVDNSHAISRNLLAIFTHRMRDERRALLTSRDKRKQSEKQAFIDALTGLHNRHWMDESFPRTLNRCGHNDSPCSIMMADIDHFKKVNDTRGHQIGDLALKTIAKVISEQFRPHDLLARYGGEEFVIMLPDTYLLQAKNVAERVRKAVAATTIDPDGEPFKVTISIGISTSQQEHRLDFLIKNADSALYRAKELGRDRVEIFG